MESTLCSIPVPAPHSYSFAAMKFDEKAREGPSELREQFRDRTESIEDGVWTRRGCTPRSFRFTDNPAVNPHERQAIKPRHLHMIAAGACVGAGLFVGSGTALAYGGPGSSLVAFSIVSVMVVLVVQALGELAVMYPSSGSFHTYYTRFIHPSWGFALGWNYAFMWMVVVPLELTVCAITMSYWNLDVSAAAYIAIFMVIILILSLFGSAAYGESEFWATLIKLVTMVVFIVVAAICIAGKGPADGKFHDYQGGKTWFDPGAFPNGFKGLCATGVVASAALNGTEIIGLAVAETEKPAKEFPRAVKHVFWRCLIFYIIVLLLLGFLVASNDPRLLSTAAGALSAKASPFVIMAQDSGLKGLDSFFNSVILIAVISVGIAGIYSASRTLAGLADDGMAPAFLGKRDVAGRAPWAILSVVVFSNIAFMTLSSGGVNVFEWLLSLTSLCAMTNWASICVSHISFRIQCKKEGFSLDRLAYKAPCGIAGSVVATALIVLALLAQLYIAVSPLVGSPSAYSFFKAYLAMPVILSFAVGNYIYRRLRKIRSTQIPLQAGCRSYDASASEAVAGRSSLWKRILLAFL